MRDKKPLTAPFPLYYFAPALNAALTRELRFLAARKCESRPPGRNQAILKLFHVSGGRPLAALLDLELDALTFCQGAESFARDSRVMHKNIPP